MRIFWKGSHFFVPLNKLRSFENEKKNKFSFCILLTYLYLCNWKILLLL